MVHLLSALLAAEPVTAEDASVSMAPAVTPEVVVDNHEGRTVGISAGASQGGEAEASGLGEVDCNFAAMQLGNQAGRWRGGSAQIQQTYQHDLKGQEVRAWWPGNAGQGPCQNLSDAGRGCWYRARLLNDVACTAKRHCLHLAAHDGEATHTYTCPTWIKDHMGRRCSLPKKWQACPENFHVKRTSTGVPQHLKLALGRTCGLGPDAQKLVGDWVLNLDSSKWSVDVSDSGTLQFHGSGPDGKLHGTLKHSADGWWEAALRGENDLPNGMSFRTRLDDKGELESASRRSEDEEWTTPVKSYKDIKTYGGTGGGESCIFPFEHSGVKYYGCTRADDPNGLSWCMTSAGGSWGYCKGQVPKPDTVAVQTHGGTAHGASCVFPFTHSGKEHKACVSEGEASPWCMTDDMGNWGYCNCRVPNRADKEHPSTTHGGSAVDGSTCKFPFTFKDKEARSCIRDGEEAPWCMTDDKGNWGYCDCSSPAIIEQVPRPPKPIEKDAAPLQSASVAPDTDLAKVAGAGPTHQCTGDTSAARDISMIFDVHHNSWYRCTQDFVCEPYEIKAIGDPGTAACGSQACQKDEFCFTHKVDSKATSHECVPDSQVWVVSDGDDVAKFQGPAWLPVVEQLVRLHAGAACSGRQPSSRPRLRKRSCLQARAAPAVAFARRRMSHAPSQHFCCAGGYCQAMGEGIVACKGLPAEAEAVALRARLGRFL